MQTSDPAGNSPGHGTPQTPRRTPCQREDRRWPGSRRSFLSHRLYLRIYLAVVASLALVALLFGLMWRWSLDPERSGGTADVLAEIAAAVLPPPGAPPEVQQGALEHWRTRIRGDFALYDAMGERIAAAGGVLPAPLPGQTKSGWLTGHPPAFALRLPDARWLVVRRAWGARQGPVGVMGVLALIALAVGIGAYPVIRRLTRRLERLQAGVEALGAGELSARVAVQGCDEVARLAASFNQSAARIEALVLSQKALLANASHELRSPLARLRMAFELIDDGAGTDSRSEIAQNIAELDQLIEEILLASRLESGQTTDPGSTERFDFTAVVAEECARAHADLRAEPVMLIGEARLLRRLVRNLLENARRYGAGSPIEVAFAPLDGERVELAVSDRGPGIPEEHRQRIFDPFYRLPGTREGDGGIGLGLALVRGIAEKHGGSVRCEAGSSGGTRFVVVLPK